MNHNNRPHFKGEICMNTVGELKEFIKNLDDNMPLVKRSDNFELRGAIDVGIYPRVGNFKTEIKEFIDDFDYAIYCHEVYVRDKEGIECLLIH